MSDGDRPRGGVGELTEDATGFGVRELRLTRDLLLRPRRVMSAYDTRGATGGGLYPKPLRYYLELNGLYLLIVTLTGGFDRTVGAGLTRTDLAAWAASAGKSVDEFGADLDQWFSLLSVPVFALFVAGPVYLLIRKWSPADDRTDFRQTFTFLNLWTLYILPIGIVGLFSSTEIMLWLNVLMFGLLPGVYLIIGKGRWWRTRGGAVLKGAVLLAVTAIAMLPASVLVGMGAYAGARFMP